MALQLENELLELSLLADMVQKLSAVERGLQPSQGASIATRLRSCKDRLKSLQRNTEIFDDAGRSHSATLHQTDSGGFSSLGAKREAAQATLSLVTATPGRAGTHTVPRAPQPPSVPASGAAVVATTSAVNQGSAVDSGSRSTKGHENGSPRHHHNDFQVKKPSSVRVAQVAREVPPATTVGVTREVAKNVAATIYNLLETITNITESQSAHVFLRMGDEMVSIVNVGAKLNFPPKLVRQNCQGSLAAGVTTSGIAINQRTIETGRPPSSVLIFPLKVGFSASSTSSTSPTSSGIAGVLQLNNKHGGASGYSELDENVANICGALIGELIAKFSISWDETFYDPITQHMVAPFVPKIHGSSAASRQQQQDNSIFLTAADTGATSKKTLNEILDTFVTPQLIRRITLPLTQTGSGPVGLGAAPSLKEVDSYLENLHDCWRKSVEMNVTQAQTDRQKTKEMKLLRDDLAMHRAKCTKIEEELRLHTLDSSDYQREYGALKDELDRYLKAKGRLES